MARTLRLCLLVEGFGRRLADDTGGVVTGITEPEAVDEVLVEFVFEPERVRGLLEALTATEFGGEAFVVLDLQTSVRESGPGTGRLSLRLVETE